MSLPTFNQLLASPQQPQAPAPQAPQQPSFQPGQPQQTQVPSTQPQASPPQFGVAPQQQSTAPIGGQPRGNASIGGAFLPQQQPSPVAAVGSTPTNIYVQQLESRGVLPRGQFASDEDLLAGLFSLADQQHTELERLRTAQTVAPASQVMPPQQQPAIGGEDLTRAATAMQQANLLKFENGSWVAASPVAAQIATTLNQRILEAQARTVELADPTSFIDRYGKDVIAKHLTPLQQQLEAMKKQNELLQQQVMNALPKPYEGFMSQYKPQLQTTGPNGQVSLTPAGQVYASVWDQAVSAGIRDESQLHSLAEAATLPLLQRQQAAPPVQQAAPQQPWIATVNNSVPANPAFAAPGSVMGNHNPAASDIPINQFGLPDMQAMIAQGFR